MDSVGLAVLILLSSAAYAVVADDVLVLTDTNFETEIKKHHVTLVEFYAPWCGHCKRLAPEYEKAATELKSVESAAALAKIDCTKETSICSRFGVSGYPTLKVFKDGEFANDYEGARENSGIVKAMLKASGPVAKNLETVEDAQNWFTDAVGVFGFFDSESSKDYKDFLKVADQVEDLRFAYTFIKEVKEHLKQTEDGIVLYRPKILQNKFEDSEVRCTESDTSKIKSFLENEALGLCAERNANNAYKFGKPIFVAYFNVDYTRNPKGTNYWRNRVMKVGKKIRDEGESVFFGISNQEEIGRELEECGIQDKSSDKPNVCAFDANNKKYRMTEEFSVDTFEQFIRDVLAGKVEPYLKSEPIPEANDEPVKVVVGKNFDEIVNNEDKDVLIEFYAPWCGHCKSLEPKYVELAEKLKDEAGITIAKMDTTANDVPSSYDVRGFPTIYFAPKGSKSSPKKYEGGREVNDFVKYLAKESTDGLSGYSRDGKKKKAKKTEL